MRRAGSPTQAIGLRINLYEYRCEFGIDTGNDEMNGGEGSDLIDAAANETSAIDAPDLVDCGRGNDRAIVRSNDIVRDNCEDVDVERTATAATSSESADDQEQQRQKEHFLQRRGN